MEEIWNKYKEEQLQTSAYMFRQNEKVYKQIFFDAFEIFSARSAQGLCPQKELEQKEKINRVEVIQKDKGRVYTNYNVKSCVIQEQDNGETLKIFLDYE